MFFYQQLIFCVYDHGKKMRLRTLEKKDIPFMLEWMHDPTVNCNFRFDAKNQTEKTVNAFIEEAQNDELNKHFAIVNDQDEYQGTISLKNIDRDNLKAEYAVCFRQCAQGKGYASFATKEILQYAFGELDLNRVYLNVLVQNKRANAFYKKFGFIYEGQTKEDVIIRGEKMDLNWYRILEKEYKEKKNTI